MGSYPTGSSGSIRSAARMTSCVSYKSMKENTMSPPYKYMAKSPFPILVDAGRKKDPMDEAITQPKAIQSGALHAKNRLSGEKYAIKERPDATPLVRV
jgi:hypothetical protein